MVVLEPSSVNTTIVATVKPASDYHSVTFSGLRCRLSDAEDVELGEFTALPADGWDGELTAGEITSDAKVHTEFAPAGAGETRLLLDALGAAVSTSNGAKTSAASPIINVDCELDSVLGVFDSDWLRFAHSFHYSGPLDIDSVQSSVAASRAGDGHRGTSGDPGTLQGVGSSSKQACREQNHSSVELPAMNELLADVSLDWGVAGFLTTPGNGKDGSDIVGADTSSPTTSQTWRQQLASKAQRWLSCAGLFRKLSVRSPKMQ